MSVPRLLPVPRVAAGVLQARQGKQRARAELLLEQALECDDPAEAMSLRQEAVLLTLDLPELVARRYAGRGVDHDDLVQVGRMALVKAAQRYRTDHGNGFVAYAMPTISGEVKRHFRDCVWAVRPPRRLQEVRAMLADAEERLTQSLHRTPSTDEMADALDLDRAEVSLARQCGSAYWALSLDHPDEGDVSPAVLATESADLERLLRLRSVGKALQGLTERELLIVRLRFVDDLTQSEIGAVLGVSQMQVSRLLAGILRRLREWLGDASFAA